jgi:hypothetical protein
MDFQEMSYSGVLLKSVNTFQFWLRPDNNNWHFPNASQREKLTRIKEVFVFISLVQKLYGI